MIGWRGYVRIAAAGLLTVSLAGCLLGPRYERPEFPLPEAHRGGPEEPPPESLADIPWWEVFEDPALQGLLREALVANFDLRAAAARVEEARARAGVAKSFLFPEINLTSGYISRQVSRDTEPPEDLGQPDRQFRGWDVGFSLSWEIDLFGRIRREKESALAILMSTEEARRGIWISLVGDVAQGYFALRTLDLELEIARRTIAINDETVAFYARRVEGGVSNQLELDQALANRARTGAAVPDIQRRIAIQENQIRFLLGQPPGPIPRGVALTDQFVPPAVPAGLPSALLERRPDVRQAEELLVAANADVGGAKALFFPTISLTGFFGGASQDLSNLSDSTASIWSLGAGLFQPLFQGGRIRRNYDAAKARFDEALAGYQGAAFNAFREVADALVTIETLAAERIERENEVTALEDAARLARSRYISGLSNYLEILIADQQLFDAQRFLARTRGQQLGALVRLYRTLGGGWQTEQEATDAPAEAETADTPGR